MLKFRNYQQGIDEAVASKNALEVCIIGSLFELICRCFAELIFIVKENPRS